MLISSLHDPCGQHGQTAGFLPHNVKNMMTPVSIKSGYVFDWLTLHGRSELSLVPKDQRGNIVAAVMRQGGVASPETLTLSRST